MPKKNDQKFRITIRNWDKYQSTPTGGSDRKRSLQWVRVETRLIHDPDFFELTLGQRYLWLALLLHAGSVGVPFELSTSSARVLFKLRPGWVAVGDFRALENQGFIEFEILTNERNVRDVTGRTLRVEKPKKDKPKPKHEDDQRLVELKAIYPKRVGSQPWSRAMKAANARIEAGATWPDLADGVRRYAEFCRQTDKLATEYVMMAATFFGPDKHYEQPWDPPAGKADRRLDRNIEAGRKWAEEDNGNN